MRRTLAIALGVWLVTPATPAWSEVWVRDEVRLNLRTGPSHEHRIVGTVKTGDSLTVIERTSDWTRVRLRDAREGWVPAGFLQTEPPARVQVERSEAEARREREAADALRAELAGLRETAAELEATKAQLTELEADNASLRAGARWPEWITGAVLLALGMLAGAILNQWGARRPRSRIRL